MASDTSGKLTIEELDVITHLRLFRPILESINKKLGADADKDDSILCMVKNLQPLVSLVDSINLQVQDIVSTQRDIMERVQAIRQTLGSLGTPTLQIQFEGESPMAPGQMSDTQTIQATAIETDAAGSPVTIDPANAAWGIDDPSIASLTQNSDGSATFKALKPGTATISLTDKGTNAAGTNTLTVTSAGPNQLTISFGNPQDSTPPAPAPAPAGQ